MKWKAENHGYLGKNAVKVGTRIKGVVEIILGASPNIAGSTETTVTNPAGRSG